MDGEVREEQAAEDAQGREAQDAQEADAAGGGADDYEAAIAERDARIAELEGQVAEAAKSAEAAERLRGEIAELRAQGESDRLDFALQLAGCRNVKAARAVLADHDNDVEKLREAEPWLFAGPAALTGATGLPSAGAAADEGGQLRHMREVAGIGDGERE